MHANTYNCVSSIPASPNNLLKKDKRKDVQRTSVGLLNALLELRRDPSDGMCYMNPKQKRTESSSTSQVDFGWASKEHLIKSKFWQAPGSSIQAQYSVDCSTETKGLPVLFWPNSSQGWVLVTLGCKRDCHPHDVNSPRGPQIPLCLDLPLHSE